MARISYPAYMTLRYIGEHGTTAGSGERGSIANSLLAKGLIVRAGARNVYELTSRGQEVLKDIDLKEFQELSTKIGGLELKRKGLEVEKNFRPDYGEIRSLIEETIDTSGFTPDEAERLNSLSGKVLYGEDAESSPIQGMTQRQLTAQLESYVVSRELRNLKNRGLRLEDE
jgi:hypothetical protein